MTSEPARDVRSLTLTYLQTHQVATLATTGPSGIWAAAVFYASDGFTLYFLSAGTTRHAQNIAANPQIAVTIQEDYRDWPAIKGIQLEGRVTQMQDDARTAAITLYKEKYPFIAQADTHMQRALDRVNWYAITPARLYFIDNSLGLGHRDDLTSML